MCKTTKQTQAAGLDKLRKIRPNTSAGGKTSGGVDEATKFDGVPEHVPELTFIVRARANPDDFIDGANIYHTNCGLMPTTITSIEHLVKLLSTSTAHLKRIRIVTHAHPTNMAVAMFEQSDVFHAEKAYLRGFAQDDITGLYALLSMARLQHFMVWDINQITSYIRTNSPGVLAPFGMNTNGTPSNNLRDFILLCADIVFVNANLVRRNNVALLAADKNSLLGALNVIAQQTGKLIVGTTFGTHKVAQAELDALQTFISSMTLADFGFSSGFYNFSNQINPFALVERAVAALQNNFRANLARVKQRFNQNSVIDIRGCRAGQDTDYLQAVREFFGTGNSLPRVTAPRWFQYFGRSAYSDLANNPAIRALLQTGPQATNIRARFEDWAKRIRVDPGHKVFWLNLLNGSVVEFCLMKWRTTFPKLPLPTPGLGALAVLSFKDAISRVGTFFNVATGSTPAGAVLNSLHDFVTNSFVGAAPNLLIQVNATTPPGKLQEIYLSLHQFNQTLGQALVPTTPPNPLRSSDITAYQTALIGFLEATPLAPVRAFMTAARQRLEDTNDPGIFYYMLHAGLPVFVFATQEQVAAHVVTVTNNRLVVHHDYANAAYRQWPPLLWAEPLPSANQLATLLAANDNTRRFAMMVEKAEGGTTSVAACPHPDYMDQIASVP